MPHVHDLIDFTTSAFILHPTEPKICLHYHKKLKSWLQPGGHIELHEDPVQALARELEEETGLVESDYVYLDEHNQPRPRSAKTINLPMHLSAHYIDKDHQHIDFTYLLLSKTSDLKPQSGESTQIGWFSIEQIRELHSQKQVFDNILDISEWVSFRYL